eukprot:scaffold834_cov18-Tisochrysis_lutea.AAC.1
MQNQEQAYKPCATFKVTILKEKPTSGSILQEQLVGGIRHALEKASFNPHYHDHDYARLTRTPGGGDARCLGLRDPLFLDQCKESFYCPRCLSFLSFLIVPRYFKESCEQACQCQS